MQELTLPTLPDGSAEATVEHVYVAAGEQVRRGQALALVRTTRFAYDIPAAASGTLREIRAASGDRLSPGQQLALLATAELAPEQAAPGPAADSAPHETASLLLANRPRLRATPLARRMATANAIDLALVLARSPGLLRRDDVLRFLEAAEPERGTAPVAVRAGFSVGERAANVPSALTAMEVDWSAADAYLARQLWRAKQQNRPDRRACLVSAAAGALLRHRLVHAAWDERGVRPRRGIDIQIADALVLNAADLSPAGVAKALGEQSSAGDEQPFAIVEHGAALWSEAALPDGAAAVLCVGHAERRLRVVGPNDTIMARPVSLLALVYDARVLDQRSADTFLADVCSRLEHIGSLC